MVESNSLRSSETSPQPATSLDASSLLAKGAATGEDTLAVPQHAKSYLETWIDKAAKPFITNKSTRDQFDQYGTQFLETASLFAAGKFGIGATILTYGLGQASPETSLKDRAADFALGAAKGSAMKAVFAGLGAVNGLKWAPTKGVLMGIASRDTEVIFNRGSFTNPGQALGKLKEETINPQAWALDAAVWTVGEGAFGAGNALSRGALSKSQTLSGMAMGTTFGMVSGGSAEIVKEKTAGQKIDWRKVGEQSLIHGAITGLAAGVGIKASQSVDALFAPKAAAHGPGNPDPQAIQHDPEIVRRNQEVAQKTVAQIEERLKAQGVNLDGFKLQAGLNNKPMKGSVLSFRVPKFTADSLVRVDNTDVPELPVYTNPSPKEFKILSGQERLNAFRRFDIDGLTLGVKELIGKKWGLFKQYGPEKQLFVQRLGGNEGTLMPEAKSADLVVSCHPENLSEADKANHVFPDAHGKVWMVTGDRDSRLLLSAGDHPISVWRQAGYRYPIRLDGGYTTINVMAPLLVGDPHDVDGKPSQGAWKDLDGMLKVLKEDIGVDAVSTDVWWGLIEPEKRNWKWRYYDKLSDHIIGAELKWVPILSFHQCGGNVGDNETVLLPKYVWADMAAKVSRSEDAFKFKSEQGHYSNEYISYWADDVAMEHYEAVMREFQSHFADKAKKIGEINISLGPAGELRYPSYNGHDQNVGYPSRGALQAYGELAIESLRDFALTKYGGIEGVRKAWNIPDLTEEQILPPSDANSFFNRNDHVNTQYGRDFFDWYNQSLIDHGNRMLGLGLKVFGTQGAPFYGIDIGAKIPGVHWRIGHWDGGRIVPYDRLAELTAGLTRTSASDWWDDGRGNGYRPTLSFLHHLLPNRPGQGSLVVPSMTCLEMPDGQDGPDAQAMPHTLARWVGQEAARQGLWLKGENALAGNLNDANDWDRMEGLLDLPFQNGYYHGLTFLRMSDIVNNPIARAKIIELLHAVRSVEARKRTAA